MPKELCGITYYSVVEAAQMLSIHKVTLRRYIQEGRVQATRIGRPYYITHTPTNTPTLIKTHKTKRITTPHIVYDIHIPI